jgi:hypothetical protein
MKNLFFWISACLFTIHCYGQEWTWATRVGRIHNPAAAPMVYSNASGDLFTAATFQGFAKFGDTTFYSGVSENGWDARASYVARLSAENTLRWAHKIGGWNTALKEISVDKNNTTFVLGTWASQLTFSDTVITNQTSDWNSFITAYSAAGKRKWLKLLPFGTGFGHCFTSDNKGDLIVINRLQDKIELQKYNGQGNEIWTKTIVIPTGFISRVQCDHDNNIYISGRFYGGKLEINDLLYYSGAEQSYGSFLLKLNKGGELKNTEVFPSCNIIGFDFDSQNNIYLAGDFAGSTQLRQVDLLADTCSFGVCEEYFIAKLSAGDKCLWARQFSKSASQVYPRSLSVHNDGTFLLAGTYYHSLEFDDITLSGSESRSTAFVFKFSANGNALSALQNEGTYLGNAQAENITTSSNGSAYVTGYYQSKHFYPASYCWFGEDTLPATNNHLSIFIARMGEALLTEISPVKTVQEALLVVSPNPNEGVFRVSMNISGAPTKLNIYDLLGNRVLTRVITNSANEVIDISDKPKGIYFVELDTGKEKLNKKIMVN